MFNEIRVPMPPVSEPCEGMALRDYFAGMAVQGMLANPQTKRSVTNSDFAEIGYSLADAMMAQREKK